MSATSVGVMSSGKYLWSKGRYGSCGWQVKLCDPLAIGPYLSALEMRFMTKRYTNRRSLLCFYLSHTVAGSIPWCESVCQWWALCRRPLTTWHWARAGRTHSSWSEQIDRQHSALDAVGHWTEVTWSLAVDDVVEKPSTSLSELIQGRRPETLGRNSS